MPLERTLLQIGSLHFVLHGTLSGDCQVSMWISCRHYMETILHEMNSLPELWSSFQSHVVIVGSPSFPNRHWMHRANCTSWSPQHLGRPADSLSRASLTELEPAMTMQQYYNSAYFITRPSMTGQRHEEKFPVKISGPLFFDLVLLIRVMSKVIFEMFHI